MSKFFDKTKTVSVSRIDALGWWIENTTEHVVKSTALGDDFTQNIYVPSSPKMIAKYDRKTDSWSSEVVNMTMMKFWNANGQVFIIGTPDGDYPDWAIKQEPPKYDDQTQTVFYIDSKGWKVYEIQIGKRFYCEHGKELIVSDYNFDLPENHTFTQPPKVAEGNAPKLVNGVWVEMVDNRGKVAFAKDRDNNELPDYTIEKLEELPITHTLLEPNEFDSWDEETQSFKYDPARYRPVWIENETQWQNKCIEWLRTELIDYNQDLQIPEKYSELRKTSYTTQQFNHLIEDRALLSEYLKQPDFPECGRPKLKIIKIE